MLRLLVSLCLVTAAVGVPLAAGCAPAPLPRFEFARAGGIAGWAPTHDVGPISQARDGMLLTITGADPYIIGPARDYPRGTELWLTARVRAPEAGIAQVFYWGPGQGPAEERSVKFMVSGDNKWSDARVPMPSLGPGTRLRFDPPGTSGQVTVAWVRFERRSLPTEPRWPRPTATRAGHGLAVRSGGVVFRHAPGALGAFTLTVAGTPMASGHNRPLLGYVGRGQVRWLDLNRAGKATVRALGPGVEARLSARDADGATWTVVQRFTPGRSPGCIDADVRITADRTRDVYYLPMLVAMPGLGSFGTKRERGLFPGLEYLDPPDKSSSTADIEGPGSDRQVPDSAKITFPLMCMQARGRWIALTWAHRDDLSAVYDTPDRLFRSGGNVMGVLFPGSDGMNRVEGKLLPYAPVRVPAGRPVTLRATLMGGTGESVLPAVQRYVALRGLPPLPRMPVDRAGYDRLMAHGWLESGVRVGDQFRHAWWPGSSFGPTESADAPLYMEWLAARVPDADLSRRLREQAERTIGRLPAGSRAAAAVAHVTTFAPGLVYGDVAECVRQAVRAARTGLERFAPDGTVHYRPDPARMDFGRTHFEKHANGTTAPQVTQTLRAAALSGDRALLEEGLRLLDGMDRYTNTAPRGAQTWEVPLHTPDILASAYMVYAYVLGYELTGERRYLDRAVHWAWTGVPFVYLVNPTRNPVGPYATIPVFGSTHWTAVNWMGLPVQWCGLVYSDALYRLARYHAAGPWRRLADGITVSGVQQSWPIDGKDLGGLLPDSYVLRARVRNPVAINPGTVQANAVQMLGAPVYDYHVARQAGAVVHAPGALRDVSEGRGRLAFRVVTWLPRPYAVLVAGLKGTPTVRIDGIEATVVGASQWLPDEGILVLRLEGDRRIEVTAP